MSGPTDIYISCAFLVVIFVNYVESIWLYDMYFFFSSCFTTRHLGFGSFSLQSLINERSNWYSYIMCFSCCNSCQWCRIYLIVWHVFFFSSCLMCTLTWNVYRSSDSSIYQLLTFNDHAYLVLSKQCNFSFDLHSETSWFEINNQHLYYFKIQRFLLFCFRKA